jgi:hypothetical protein
MQPFISAKTSPPGFPGITLLQAALDEVVSAIHVFQNITQNVATPMPIGDSVAGYLRSLASRKELRHDFFSFIRAAE